MTDTPDRWTRLGLIFEEAERLEGDARAPFVEKATAGDEDLRREVLSLLASHRDAGPFLSQPAADVGAALLGSSAPAWGPGRQLGPYRLAEELGRGGMGLVFLAEDTRLGRRVALKILDPAHVASPASRERLRQEARAAAQLSHPGIATVYVLEEIDRELCLAVEYIQGRTLRDWIDDQDHPLDQAVDIARQVAAALEAAHNRSIVHRDLKPENVMIDGEGRARILDFGIARIMGADDRVQRLTEPGSAVGTPAYMAPEQLQGDAVDRRADIFAFGILLYELVTGVHPFQGPTRTATQARILTATAAPLARYRGPVPAPLQRVVSRCLQKAPDGRYQETSELVRDLDAVVAVLAAPAAGHSPEPALGSDFDSNARSEAEAARRWWRAHQWLVMTTVLGLLIAAWWVAAWIGSPVRFPLFLGLLVCGVSAGTLRAHLLFVEWTRPHTIHGELRRLTPWLRVLDVILGAAVGASALAVGPGHPMASTVLLVAAAITTVSVFVMEPATTRSAFGRTPEP
jgi:predicted Ser/Thr protein kinase